MDAAKRIRLSRIAEKMDKNKEYACKIGMKNNTKLKTSDKGDQKC